MWAEWEEQYPDHLSLHLDCVKSVHIRSFSGPYFHAFGLNTVLENMDQKNSEYRNFSHSFNGHIKISISLKVLVTVQKQLFHFFLQSCVCCQDLLIDNRFFELFPIKMWQQQQQNSICFNAIYPGWQGLAYCPLIWFLQQFLSNA